MFAAASAGHQVWGFLLSLGCGAVAERSEPWSSRACWDVFVVAIVPPFTSGAARKKFPGLLAGALITLAIVLAAAWPRGTVPADLWDAVVTFRL